LSSRTYELTRLAQPAAGAIAGGGCAFLLYLANPHRHQVFLPCPFHALTGLYCPFCGGLRMVHDLLHGDLTAALHDNALAVPAVIIGVAAWLNWTICRWRGRPAPSRPTWLSPVLIAVMIAWTVVRNLPWAPFAALRPTALRLSRCGSWPCGSWPCGGRLARARLGEHAWRLRRGRLVDAAGGDQCTR
jgi:hypothetical protein